MKKTTLDHACMILMATNSLSAQVLLRESSDSALTMGFLPKGSAKV